MPSFPQSILDTRVELLLAGVWTDITTKVYSRDQLNITRGHPDEGSGLEATVCAMTLNNQGGLFSPRNPVGTYYGKLTRNTQLRTSVPEGATYLRSETDTTSGASTPTSAGLNIAGDIDVRAEVTLDNWFANQTLAAKYDLISNNIGWGLLVGHDSTLVFVWSSNGSALKVAQSTVAVGLPALRHLAVRATLSVATGTVTFYTAATIGGSWTQLGATVVLGATSIFASNQPLVVGYNASLAATSNFNGVQGKIHAVSVMSGIGGTVKASPTFTAQAAGTTSFADAQGNTWTLFGTAEISDRKYRCHVEVPAWPPRWDVTGNDVYTPIQGSGRWRRLTAGTPPTNSALYRAFVRATGTDSSGNSLVPLAYWPAEDGANSTQIAAAIGGSPMTVTGTVNFASFSDFPSSQPIPTISGSAWTGVVAAAPSTPTVNCVKFLLAVPSTGGLNNDVLVRVFTTGTVAQLDLAYSTGGNLIVNAYSPTGASLGTTGVFAAGVDGQLLLGALILAKDGTGVDCSFDSANFTTGLVGGAGFTVASSSVGQVTRVTVNPNANVDGTAVGHVAVGVSNDLNNYIGPLQAWVTEAAGARFVRLCTEEGIASRIVGDAADTVLMGYQTARAVSDLLQEVEDADKGLLFEPKQCFGLGYRTRVSMFNQAAAVALTYTSAQLSAPVEPTDDDRLILNDATVTRASGGSSARSTITSGPLSTQDPPNGVGLYDQGKQINLASDAQLADEAGWLTWLGTVDDLRYPVLPWNLARTALASVYYQVQDLDIGDRVTVAATPSQLPPDGISQLIQGQSETCFQYTFSGQLVCAPESPYRVGVLDDPVLGRADTDGSTVHTGISSGAASMLVDTTDPTKPLWTIDPAEFPFDVLVGGERMTVTNITGSSSPQTFSITRSVNGVVKSQTAGTDVRLFQPAVLSM